MTKMHIGAAGAISLVVVCFFVNSKKTIDLILQLLNPLSWIRLTLFAAALFLAFVLMAKKGWLPEGVMERARAILSKIQSFFSKK